MPQRWKKNLGDRESFTARKILAMAYALIRADFTFSAKADYRDYHHKVTTYIGRIAGEAAVIDPTIRAKHFPRYPSR